MATQALVITVPVLAFQLLAPVAAADLDRRSVTLGTSRSSAVTTHRFNFDIATAGVIGSLEFEYCDNNPFVGTACTAPGGLSVLAATINAQSGAVGFSVDASTTANRLVLTRVPAAAVAGAASYTIGNVTNPSGVNQSFYVRISTFASNDATGPRTDSGAVVFSTSGEFGATGFVPPYITFCVGLSVALNCSTVSGALVSLGEFSSSLTRFTTSQFSTATNDPTGYVVYTLGTTMTSGNNSIPALATAQPSNPGTGQFGLNLRDNSVPDVGSEPAGVGTGAAQPGYAIPNNYRYQNGGAIASSPISTEFNRFTVSYIVNVANGQPAGVYSTTLTYMAVAAF